MFYGSRERGYLKVKSLAKSHIIKKTSVEDFENRPKHSCSFGLSRVDDITDADELEDDLRELRGCLCGTIFSAKSNIDRLLL